MLRAVKLVLLVLVLVTVPLRGVAAAWGPPHGMESGAGHEGCHETQNGSNHGSGDAAAEGAGGHCAACPVGAPALPVALFLAPSAELASFAIPFVDRSSRAPIPWRLYRPPLAL